MTPARQPSMHHERWIGVVCEYNPLHNGHAFHLHKIKEKGYRVACVMSGSYVQRAEPAICDKWARAMMALEAGADLIVELPALYSVRAAHDFARAGVATLKLMGIGAISFGSEIEDEALLTGLARTLAHESEDVSRKVRAGMAAGLSYPRALTEALLASPGADSAAAHALTSPNATLGIEYLRAGIELDWPLQPLIVKRNDPHHGQGIHAMASASAIRRAWLEEGLGAALPGLPDASARILRDAAARGEAPVGAGMLDLLALDALRERSRELIGLPDWETGVERRLCAAAHTSDSLPMALQTAKCKRYTMARLRRLSAQLLLGVTPRAVESAPLPDYLRILGLREAARPLLRRLSDSGVRVVTRAAEIRDHPAMGVERRATDLQALCLAHKQTGRDWTRSPILLH